MRTLRIVALAAIVAMTAACDLLPTAVDGDPPDRPTDVVNVGPAPEVVEVGTPPVPSSTVAEPGRLDGRYTAPGPEPSRLDRPPTNVNAEPSTPLLVPLSTEPPGPPQPVVPDGSKVVEEEGAGQPEGDERPTPEVVVEEGAPQP